MYRIVPHFPMVMLKRQGRYIFFPKVFHPVASFIRYYCANHFLAVLSRRELLILEHSSGDGEPTLLVSLRLFTCAKGKKVETSAFVSFLVTFAIAKR